MAAGGPWELRLDSSWLGAAPGDALLGHAEARCGKPGSAMVPTSALIIMQSTPNYLPPYGFVANSLAQTGRGGPRHRRAPLDLRRVAPALDCARRRRRFGANQRPPQTVLGRRLL